jgi:putative transposase
MGAFSFRVGLAFEWGGVPYRIERLHEEEQVLLQQVDNGRSRIATRQELLDAYCDTGPEGIKAAVPQANRRIHFGRPISDLPQKVQDEVRRRKHYIDAVAKGGRPLFTEDHLLPLLEPAAAEIADKKPPSVPTFWRWRRRYQVNQDVRALAPHSRTRIQQTGNSELFDLLREAVAEAMAASPLANSVSVHTALVKRVDAANVRKLDEAKLRTPCLRTVQRLLKDAPRYDLAVLREGKAAAERKFRMVVRSVKTSHILERVEVDHTPLDLFLIDDATKLPLGRPIVTIFIDHKSRMVIGYYVGFGQPPTAAVMAALRHAILPKKAAPAVVPDLKVVNTWTCYGRPLALILDNGLEFHSDDLESVALDLGITLQYCPKHEPRFKGVVERFLKTLNYSFAHQLPGTSFARLHQRGDYDPAKHALMTLAEFRHIFEKWLLDIYGQTVHRGVKGMPLALWNVGARLTEPELPPDRAALQRRIGMVEQRVLHSYGIDLHNVRYCGAALARLFDLHGAGTAVRIVFDPEDVGEIQVWGPQEQEPITVRAQLYEEYRGITSSQAKFLHERTTEMGLSLHDKAALQKARVDLAESVQALLGSRKQRDRRRSAAMRGLSATRGDEIEKGTNLPQSPPPQRETPTRSSPLPARSPTAVPTKAAPREPTLLPRFTLKSGGSRQ